MLFIFFLFSMNVSAQNYQGKKKDIDRILKNTESFSQYYMKGEYKKMADSYTVDGKIFPTNSNIIEGKIAIEKKWILPEGIKILHHKVSPKEINVIKKYAYDYGIYEGKTLKSNGEIVSWKGKYVIVWKKEKGDWKIYLDIWNRIKIKD